MNLVAGRSRSLRAPQFWAESVDDMKGERLPSATFLFLTRAHSDDFHTPAFHMFLYDSMTDIGKQLAVLAETSIPLFIEVGERYHSIPRRR